MSQLAEFESTLKETVQAKRLSASKVTKLTEIAMKSMEDDTQLVSILYRTHKSLSSSGKVSSLYVFDALCRAARHQANKKNLTGDLDSAKGNSATFLLRVEGILDGLFQDMLSTQSTELKDKAKKILDIWVKGNTFPAVTLARLQDLWKGKDIVKDTTRTKVAVPSDPRTTTHKSPTPPTTTTTPVPTPPNNNAAADPQSTLLALLAQAVSAGSVAAVSTSEQKLPPVTSSSTEVVPQLALLQQLAQTVNSGLNLHSSLPPSSSVATDLDHSQFPYRDESFVSHPRTTQYNRYGSPDRRDYGSPKSPTSGYRNSRTHEEHRGHRTEYHRDRSPHSRRPRSSRSKSPPGRYTTRRESENDSSRRQSSSGGLASAQKDEFGRDIRPISPEISKDSQIQSAVPSSSKPSDPRNRRTASAEPPATTSITHSLMTNSTSSSIPSGLKTAEIPTYTSPISQEQQYGAGLDQFDVSQFDFTSPAAWEALGKMWEVTYNVVPTTEQLMQFVMTAGFGAAQGCYGNQYDWSNDQNAAAGAGQGNASGLSGVSIGNTSLTSTSGTAAATSDSSSQNNTGGQMQKVGDKWMFVRTGDRAEISS